MQRSDQVLMDGAAGGFGILAVCWVLFSLFGVLDFSDSHRWTAPLSVNALPDYVIWGLHGVFIAAAVWCHRRKQRVGQGVVDWPADESVWPPPPQKPE